MCILIGSEIMHPFYVHIGSLIIKVDIQTFLTPYMGNPQKYPIKDPQAKTPPYQGDFESYQH